MHEVLVHTGIANNWYCVLRFGAPHKQIPVHQQWHRDENRHHGRHKQRQQCQDHQHHQIIRQEVRHIFEQTILQAAAKQNGAKYNNQQKNTMSAPYKVE